MKKMKMLGAFLAVCGLLSAQTPDGVDTVHPTDAIFRVTSVSRTAKAINYQHRKGATTIDFAGTSLMPKARGEAKVEGKQGYIEIEVEFDDLQPAVRNGSRIPHLRALGDYARGPYGQPGRSLAQRHQE